MNLYFFMYDFKRGRKKFFILMRYLNEFSNILRVLFGLRLNRFEKKIIILIDVMVLI